MLAFEELQYLAAFAETGTLSGVAERYHISQPTITRSMKKLEDSFDVPLFERTKNSIRLNDNGLLAAEEASRVLKQADDMLQRVRTHDRANHTISIGSAAAVQIPDLVRKLSEAFPQMTISSQLKKPAELMDGLENGMYQLIVLPFLPDNPSHASAEIGKENLMFYLPKNHRFAKRKSLALGDMNGENILLFSEIGFWHDIVVEKMPDSRFLVQNERYSLEELILNTVLPCFATNLTAGLKPQKEKRVCVPISDAEVNVTYYLVCKKEDRKKYAALLVKSVT